MKSQNKHQGKKVNKQHPPKISQFLLDQLLGGGRGFEELGDLEECFRILLQKKGRFYAVNWYRIQVCRYLPIIIKNLIYWRTVMFRNYFKIALRCLLRHRTISVINILGLSVGIACSILILLWVDGQLSMDKSQLNRDQIYRLESGDWASMPTIFRRAFPKFSEIEQFVQFNSWQRPVLKYQDRMFEIEDFVFVDSNVFDMFTFEFHQGNPTAALEAPFSLVLTENESRRIFGDENPIGKILRYDNRFDYAVTGVIADPHDFHVRIGALAPLTDLIEINQRETFLDERNWNFLTYLLLAENIDVRILEDKLNPVLNQLETIEENNYFLRPFKEIYFDRSIKHEGGIEHGNLQLLVLFAAAAVFILLIACFNFINLITARASLRSKEISMRKVVGAERSHLALQFMGETLLTVVFASLLAVLLIRLIDPLVGRLLGSEILHLWSNPKFLIGMLVIPVFTCLAAGIYPSLYLSSLNPFLLLKGKRPSGKKESPLRKVLIVLQFSISIFLIICAAMVYRQTSFMQSQDLGFTQSPVLNITLRGELQTQNKSAFRQRLLSFSGINAVSFASQAPGNITNTNTWVVRGREKALRIINTDPEYLALMGLELIEGRNLSRERLTDVARSYIINQEAAHFLELPSPVGERIDANFGSSQIIGVVKDFHFNSLHNRIEPLAIAWYEPWANVAQVKISGSDVTGAIAQVRSVWQELCPGFPFVYTFMDEDFARQYIQEQKLAEILKYFVLLAVMLSCLGLFGLAAFIAEDRTKEIGIRKVLGASIPGILLMLSKNFSCWVLLGNFIAWPAAYFAIHQWIKNFAYRTSISWDIFLMAAGVTLLVALAAVSSQTLRAALANPVESLRWE